MQNINALVYTLRFYNDGGEWENYGVYATHAAAEAVIAQLQAEHGEDCFATDCFEIEEQSVRA